MFAHMRRCNDLEQPLTSFMLSIHYRLSHCYCHSFLRAIYVDAPVLHEYRMVAKEYMVSTHHRKVKTLFRVFCTLSADCKYWPVLYHTLNISVLLSQLGNVVAAMDIAMTLPMTILNHLIGIKFAKKD
ncbi:hypothetical protein TMatcc_002500 [Talaromyces marneffei ATCC 18224]